MTLALGIDIGTSGIRTAVLDPGGTLISTARADHLPQGANIDATLWWDAVRTCIAAQTDALVTQGRSSADITAIAIDGTSGSMVLTDANLTPVSPALMYNSKGFDAEAEAIDQANPDPTHITKGANSALARARRLVNVARARPAHLLHQADFVAAQLTRSGGHSDHNNALKTGYDPASESWPDWIDQIIDTALLPVVHPTGTPIAPIAPDVAASLGISLRAQVHAGTTDSVAAFLAAAPLSPGAAVTSIGSTLAVKILSHQRIDLPAQGLYSHRLGDFWLAGGASNTGGAVLAHFFTPQQLADLSAQIDPAQPCALDYYPLLIPGERFPINDPAHPPRLTPRPENDAAFLHGLLDGIARIEATCYQLIKDQGGLAPKHLFTAGGAAQNTTLRALRERRLGLPIQSAQHTEAAIGAAKLCQIAL